MARPTVQSQVKRRAPSYQFGFAAEADDAELRELLRATPMPGPIQITLEREPSIFAAARAEGGRHHTACARDPNTGRIVVMGSRTVRKMYVNGEPRQVGYLSQLRIASGSRHLTPQLLRRGFAVLRETHAGDEVPFDITTIVAGNEAARRVLEAGLPGLPRYTPVDEIVTMLIPSGRMRPPSAPLLGHEPCQFQVVNSLPAIWDQRAFKQIVVRGYAPWLQRCRWLMRLPPVGTVLPVAYWTQPNLVAVPPQDCRWMALGLSIRHPLLPELRRRYRPREYVSTLYLVHDAGTTVRLDGRLTHVEIALL